MYNFKVKMPKGNFRAIFYQSLHAPLSKNMQQTYLLYPENIFIFIVTYWQIYFQRLLRVSGKFSATL